MNAGDLIFPLGVDERKALYARLGGIGAPVFTEPGTAAGWEDAEPEEILAIAGEQSRFDYRLLYVLVALMADRPDRFHPFKLREAIRRMKTPAVWGVVMEYARKINTGGDLKAVAEVVTEGLRPAPQQMYFGSLRTPRPGELLRTAVQSPDEFVKWGFFSDEPPVLKEFHAALPLRSYSPESRRRILKELFLRQGSVGLSDYLEAVGHSVSRQQAHKDLTAFPGVRPVSDRRGRKYRLAGNSPGA